MNRKNLEKCKNFSFLKGAKMRYLDVINVSLLINEKSYQKRLKISFKRVWSFIGESPSINGPKWERSEAFGDCIR